MRGIVALALVAVFLLLAALHVYWALGGEWGARAAIPEVGGRPAFQPGRAGTLIVAGLLGLATAIIEVRAWGGGGDRVELLARAGTWVLSGIFALRAVGNFDTFGFLKVPRDTAFARYDTLVYSPLCLALGLGCLLVALHDPNG